VSAEQSLEAESTFRKVGYCTLQTIDSHELLIWICLEKQMCAIEPSALTAIYRLGAPSKDSKPHHMASKGEYVQCSVCRSSSRGHSSIATSDMPRRNHDRCAPHDLLSL